MIMKKMLLLAAVAFAALSCGTRTRNVEITVPDDLDPEYAVNLVKAGEKAPDFVLTDLDGKTYTLKDFKGKTLVVDFWATWCPDCRKEIDDLVRIRKEHPEVEFVGISFDTDAEQLRTYAQEHGMDWLQLSEGFKNWKETQVSEAYGVKWIPTKYIISPKGKVLLSTVMTEKVEIFLNR